MNFSHDYESNSQPDFPSIPDEIPAVPFYNTINEDKEQESLSNFNFGTDQNSHPKLSKLPSHSKQFAKFLKKYPAKDFNYDLEESLEKPFLDQSNVSMEMDQRNASMEIDQRNVSLEMNHGNVSLEMGNHNRIVANIYSTKLRLKVVMSNTLSSLRTMIDSNEFESDISSSKALALYLIECTSLLMLIEFSAQKEVKHSRDVNLCDGKETSKSRKEATDPISPLLLAADIISRSNFQNNCQVVKNSSDSWRNIFTGKRRHKNMKGGFVFLVVVFTFTVFLYFYTKKLRNECEIHNTPEDVEWYNF